MRTQTDLGIGQMSELGGRLGQRKRGRGCLCSFETHLCAGPVLFTALQLSSARVLFRVQAFQ